MFEKEAEEYADEKCGTIETEEKKFCRIDWQRGAEFGYNKGRSEAKELLKEFVQHYKAKTIYVENMQDLLEQSEQFLSEVEK